MAREPNGNVMHPKYCLHKQTMIFSQRKKDDHVARYTTIYL